MATTNDKVPSKLQTELQDMTTGLSNTTLTLLSSMVLIGASMSKADVIVKLKSYLQLFTAASSAKQAYAATIVARKAAMPDIEAFYEGLVAIVKQAVGPTNQGPLATFGIVPPAAR